MSVAMPEVPVDIYKRLRRLLTKAFILAEYLLHPATNSVGGIQNSVWVSRTVSEYPEQCLGYPEQCLCNVYPEQCLGIQNSVCGIQNSACVSRTVSGASRTVPVYPEQCLGIQNSVRDIQNCLGCPEQCPGYLYILGYVKTVQNCPYPNQSRHRTR
ncbi:hypothetical protein Bbelb_164670 [Branchiostoma belcheri]|nr:hypothetical protein Bbelb_164670 [Branchiostoma belcheri]